MKESSNQFAPENMPWAVVGTLLAGLVVSWWALTSADLTDAITWPPAVSPFGWNRLIVVHLLAALPLAWTISQVAPVLQPHHRRGGVMVAVLAAVVIALMTMNQGSAFGERLHDAGFDGRLAVRVLWSTLLVLPWCLAAHGIVATKGKEQRRPPAVNLLGFSLTVVVAVCLPLVYTHELIERESVAMLRSIEQNRLRRAWVVVDRLCQLGSQAPLPVKSLVPFADSHAVDSGSPRAVRDRLHELLQPHLKRVSKPISAQADDEDRFQHATSLAILDQHAEAEKALGDLPEQDMRAAMLMIVLLQHQHRWEESNQWCRHVLAGIHQNDTTSQQGNAIRVEVYRNLADNLRRLDRYQAAETELLSAIKKVPEARARFLFELGKHYYLGKQPKKAMSSLLESVEVDPSYDQLAEPLIADLKLSTPACVLERIQPVSR